MIYKGLTVSIYKNPLFQECSANGISERFNEALILCDEGYIEIDTEKIEMGRRLPIIKIVKRKLSFGEVYNAKVVFDPDFPELDHDKKWSSMGGAFVHSSDSRVNALYPFYGAVALHDRYEN